MIQQKAVLCGYWSDPCCSSKEHRCQHTEGGYWCWDSWQMPLSATRRHLCLWLLVKTCCLPLHPTLLYSAGDGVLPLDVNDAHVACTIGNVYSLHGWGAEFNSCNHTFPHSCTIRSPPQHRLGKKRQKCYDFEWETGIKRNKSCK